MKAARWQEPSQPFPMEEIERRFDKDLYAEPLPNSRVDLLLMAEGAAKFLQKIIRRPSDIRDPQAIRRRVAVYAFRIGILGDITQEQLGQLLGYPKKSARKSFHALMRREEIACGLPPAGPGRNAKRGRRKRRHPSL
jgi:hypothetical protein